MTRSTIVTKVAITTMKTGILTVSGVNLLIKDVIIFELISTNNVAPVIAIPLFIEVLTAKVGHNPRSRTNTGLDSIRPLLNISIVLLIFKSPYISFISLNKFTQL